MKSLHNLICNFIDFSNKTFIGLTPLSGIEKIKEELKELEESIIHLDSKENLISEYSDCLMCLFDSANRAGITLEEIIDGFDKKLELNKTRTWKLNPNNTYSHVKNEMKGLIFIEKNLEQDKLYKSIRYQLDKLTGKETYIGYFISKTKNESNTLSSKILDLISGSNHEFKLSRNYNNYRTIYSDNNNRIIFLDLENKEEALISMNNVTDIFFNDITELDFDTFGVLFTRIRLITGLNQFICTFDKENINKNHWIYEYVFGNVNNEDDFIKYLKEELVKFGINKNQYLSDDYKQDIASTNVI